MSAILDFLETIYIISNFLGHREILYFFLICVLVVKLIS